jgi:hypothetical protein
MTAAAGDRRSRGPAILRAAAWQALIALATLSLAAAASAAPASTFKIAPVPIPGFPHTGDILGAGADVEAHVTISGTEYGGFPSPLTGATFYGPPGFRLDPSGFADCPTSVLQARGAIGCPRGSGAAIGKGLGVVSFGSERVDENVSIRGFFAPGGLTFYVEGKTPASFEILENAHWIAPGAPYGQSLVVEVPLVETVPGADDASILSFNVKLGAAYRKDGKTISYLTLPSSCPQGGFPLKSELKFLSGETVMVPYRQPCPRNRKGA